MSRSPTTDRQERDGRRRRRQDDESEDQSPAAAPSPEALWEAARTGDEPRVRALLDAGVDPDAPSRYGATALSFAAQKGHLR